jgi:LmbE family N-acetylglucosaminyl deacetylase
MAEAYMEIGQSYVQLGKYQEAANSYLQAIKINANFKEVLLEMSRIVTGENAIQWKRMAKFANNHDVLWNRVPAEPASDIIFLEPHQDDATLYGFYTLLRLKPLLISVTSSFIQPERGDAGCDAETRNKETIEAAKIAGCPVVFLNIRDTELTEEILRDRLNGFNPEKAYIPAQHENGNPQHNLIGKVALELFGKEKCEQYCTYVRGDFNIVKGSFEIIPVHNEAELKNKALDCFKSQLALPSTRPHFEAVKGKSEWLL